MANSTKRQSAAKSRDAKLTAKLVGQFNKQRQDVDAGVVVARTQNRTTTEPKQKRRTKPKFSLWLHATGQWAKKIRGRIFYFGTDKDAALKEYTRVREDREAGREPPPADEERTTIKTLVNSFLTFKKSQCELGELTQTSFNDYRASGEALAEFFGMHKAVEALRPDDLLRYRKHLGKGKRDPKRPQSPHTVGGEVNRCRVILRYAFENGLVAVPVRFGEFKRPKKSAFRRQRRSRLCEPAELRQVIDAADTQLRAMVLLGINCGFGNADCGQLPIDSVDLQAGWIEFPRPKTGVPRRAPMWEETIVAIEEWLTVRKPSNDQPDLLFVTKYGQPWHRDGDSSSPLSAEFRKLLERIDAGAIKAAKETAKDGTKYVEPPRLRRPGMSFYSLRHCFQTIGDELGDYLAVRRIMGHADNSISDHYRERFPDERLKRVVEHVHDWLYPRPTVLAEWVRQ